MFFVLSSVQIFSLKMVMLTPLYKRIIFRTICQSHRVQGNILTFCMFEMWILNLIILDNMYDSLIQWCELPLSNGYFLLNSDSKYDPFIQWRQHYHFQTEYLYWTQDKKHTHTTGHLVKFNSFTAQQDIYIHVMMCLFLLL
jgi:hypothetical protein